jgi:GTP cyclohydrolase FolE2
MPIYKKVLDQVLLPWEVLQLLVTKDQHWQVVVLVQETQQPAVTENLHRGEEVFLVQEAKQQPAVMEDPHRNTHWDVSISIQCGVCVVV